MEMKEIFTLVALFSALIFPLNGNTVGTGEDRATSAIKSAIQSYADRNDGQLPNQWSDLFRSPMELTFIDQSIAPRSVSELYAFVISPQRDLFPEGKLLLIRVAELSWPDEWKTAVNIGGYSPNEMREATAGEVEKSRAYQKPIRYIIFQDKRGKIRSDWWYEEKIQGMLSQTGIVIPPPTSYRHLPPIIPGENPINSSKHVAPVVASETAPGIAHSATPAPGTRPVTTPPAKSSNRLWWIVGIISALVVLVLIVRRKKPNA